MNKGLLIIYLMELSVMAIFDTRKDLLNKLLNVIALSGGIYFTLLVHGFSLMLLVPFLVIPVIAGILSGIVSGFYTKFRRGR